VIPESASQGESCALVPKLRRNLAIDAWDEEVFSIHILTTDVPLPAFDRLDDPGMVEAVGAADDPERFRVESASENVLEEIHHY